MFEGALSARVSDAPGDPIFGIVELFRADTRPHKINLAAGVYMDEQGVTPILPSVRAAEERLLASTTSKLYVPIGGDPAYLVAAKTLLFRTVGGAWGEVEPAAADRVQMIHTPGGTGAVRLAVDLVSRLRPSAEIWVGEPTWPNHMQIIEAARITVRRHDWITDDARSLNTGALFDAIAAAKGGDAMILHGACHNPTGIDPTPEQWAEIAQQMAHRGILPILDFAYQGFGEGLVEDAASLRAFLATGCELLVASSSSKNFALYNERVGSLAIIGADQAAATTIASHARMAVRTMWSNPPAHGGAIVATVLGDATLRAQWEGEVTAMRNRIKESRAAFAAALTAAGAGDFSHLGSHQGLFSLLGLTDEQLRRLRDEHAVYLVARGRINMAGLSSTKIPIVAKAVAAIR
ncbi:MAG: aromatic amino acid transaminase [Candidatus Limnocylindrus sp.]